MTEKRPRHLIAFCGDIGAGKTLAAKTLAVRGYKHLSWAHRVKRACHTIWDLPLDALEGKEQWAREWREKPHERLTKEFGFPATPRWLLQHFGTDACRAWHPDIWVNATTRDISKCINNNTPAVLDDTRFTNESDRVRRLGGIVVRVVRPGVFAPESGHASEHGMSKNDVDIEIVNDSTDDFQRVVLNLANFPDKDPILVADPEPDGGDFLAGSVPHCDQDEACEVCQ